MRSVRRAACHIAGGLLCLAVPLAAEIRLPAIVSDHAMFQANKPVAIWGWARPESTVHVVFRPGLGGSKDFTATADAKGNWNGFLEAMTAGTSGELTVSAQSEADVRVKDILVGEVWLASGQSNMEYDIAGTGRTDLKNPSEIAAVAQNIREAAAEAVAARPEIRYFKVGIHRAAEPEDDVRGRWVLMDAAHVPKSSAVAWNFIYMLHVRLGAPAGVIVSAVGNTPIETWMSRQSLKSTHVGQSIYERSEAELAEASPDKIAAYTSAEKAWETANSTPELMAANKSSRPRPPANLSAANYIPNQYYDGMIRGLQPYTVRGVIWYQGVGNMGHPTEYGELFPALIKQWRADWRDPALPFLFVEESNFGIKQSQPVEENAVSLIREQQHMALDLADVGMTCSIDLGNGNPHFPNKRAVGERLASLALHDIYGRSGQPHCPIFQSYKVEGQRIRLRFRNAEGLRSREQGTLRGFAIRGKAGDWLWAEGRVEGNSIIVSNRNIPAPRSVRYAWAVNPTASVENGEGLPLCPFRTDGGAVERDRH